MGLEEISGDLREADFWPGRNSGLPINRQTAPAHNQSNRPKANTQPRLVLVFVAGSVSASQAGETILHP